MTNFLKAHWENIVMVNYPVSPDVLKPFLPGGCELDLYNGSAYVSLVGFMFKNTRLFQVPIPWLGTFEEINLRFYVTRKEAGVTKRGVVFINETIPYKAVAWVANKLYKEHYTTIPTKNSILINDTHKHIGYQWQVNKVWNSMHIQSFKAREIMQQGSFEEFIFEHYYGFTKINERITEEYRIEHPRWYVHAVTSYHVQCDFSEMYGPGFEPLNATPPYAVFVAEGSAVAVNWKRNRFKTEVG